MKDALRGQTHFTYWYPTANEYYTGHFCINWYPPQETYYGVDTLGQPASA